MGNAFLYRVVSNGILEKGELNTITSATSENAFRRQEDLDALCTVGKGLWNSAFGT